MGDNRDASNDSRSFGAVSKNLIYGKFIMRYWPGVWPQEEAMKRTWTIIGVADVARSFKWYQSLFGQPETNPAHDDFGQILDTNTGTSEFALRDPDGYYVMVSALAAA